MRCAESVRVQAHFDGELDAISSLNLEQHLKHCQECSDLLQSLGHARAILRQQLPQFGAPSLLRERIQRALDIEDAACQDQRMVPARRMWRVPSFWWGSLSGAGATLVAGALAFALFAFALPAANPVVDAVLEAHVSSLMSAHLTDVVSTDRHTVKPWFAGRVEVAPAVADFAPQGYKLAGGRVDDLEHHRVAVIVYQHGPHIINVFCWPAPRGPLPGNATRRGYHIIFWRSADLAYAAVSDTGWDELAALEGMLQGVSTLDVPPVNAAPSRE